MSRCGGKRSAAPRNRPVARRSCVQTFFVTLRKWSVTQRSMRPAATFFACPSPDEVLNVRAARGEQIKVVLNDLLPDPFLLQPLLHLHRHRPSRLPSANSLHDGIDLWLLSHAPHQR